MSLRDDQNNNKQYSINYDTIIIHDEKEWIRNEKLLQYQILKEWRTYDMNEKIKPFYILIYLNEYIWSTTKNIVLW